MWNDSYAIALHTSHSSAIRLSIECIEFQITSEREHDSAAAQTQNYYKNDDIKSK